jgi:hypothetical protein
MFGNDRVRWAGEGLRRGFRRPTRLVFLEERDPRSGTWRPVDQAMPLAEAWEQMDQRIASTGRDDDFRIRPLDRPWIRFAFVVGFVILVACGAWAISLLR